MQIKSAYKLYMLKVVSTSLNMHCILSSIILGCFLSFSVNIHSVISTVNSIKSDRKLAYDSSFFEQIYKRGSVESSMGLESTVPTSFDPTVNVESKDIVYLPEFNLSARLYLPKDTTESQKLPLLVYFHGGGFFKQSPFSSTYHNFINILVSEANVISVSVQYRLADVCTLPCAYDDSWTALEWVASHLKGDGPEDWLNQHADFDRVFVSGDSAGANIAHQTALRLGKEETLQGFNVRGLILCHPYFWGEDPIPGETTNPLERRLLKKGWAIACPTCKLDNPWINPAKDPNLARLGSSRLQVFVSEKDSAHVRERGWYYAQKLRGSGWSGYQEVTDFQGEDHVFHLKNLTSRNSTILRNKIVAFINWE